MPLAPIALSLLACLSACLLLSPRRWWFRYLLGASAFLLALVTSLYVLAFRFTGRGFDESVLYHARVGLHGAGFSEYLGMMVVGVGLCLLSVFFAWLALRRRLSSEGARHWPRVLGATPLLCLAWWVNPGVSDIMATGGNYVAQPDAAALPMPEFHEMPQALTLQEGEKPRNLILIYVESLERGYFDQARFPDLLPRLKELEEASLSFTHMEQLPGLWWTIAGMVGSQCGIPLVTPPGQQDDAVEPFLPGARCLGDYLSGAGYHLEYLAGADSDFAGKGSFLRGHGFGSVSGREQLATHAEGEQDFNAWGVQDDVVFRQVARRAEALHRQGEPFVLSTLTLGTHHPRGHVSASCAERDYGDGQNPMLNAVHCTDALVGQLIDELRRQPGAENTLIAVLSDHTAMRNTASTLLEEGSRRNTLLVMGEGVEAATNERIGSQLDVAPTLLSLMGFEIESLGLGRNLLAWRPSYVEAHDDSHASLRALFPRLRTLWGVVDLKEGIRFVGNQSEVQAGSRKWGIPLMLSLDDDGRVSEILGSGAELASLPEGSDFVWIDHCSAIGVEAGPATPLCVAWSSGPDAPMFWQTLDDSNPHWTWQLADENARSLDPIREYWPVLRQGGVVQFGDTQSLALPADVPEGMEMARAVALPGHQFVRWEGLEGRKQLQPELPLPKEGAKPLQPVFDLLSGAETMQAEFQSAWIGVARVGDRVLAERLSPGGGRDSISRAALWLPNIGVVDLRAFGSYEVTRSEAFIERDGDTLLGVNRGLGLVVLDEGGEVVHARSYDTHESRQEALALAEELTTVPEGHYVLLASSDEFTASSSQELQDALSMLGFDVTIL